MDTNGAEGNLNSEVEMHASVVLWVGKGVPFRKILIEGFLREELVEQAEEMQELYDKRMEILQKSMKKQFNRKRRRVEEEEEEGGGGGAEEARLREKVAQLMEELRTERERSELTPHTHTLTHTHTHTLTQQTHTPRCSSLGRVERHS